MEYRQDEKLERRKKKTRAAIQNALLELINEKSVDKISISELAEAADINRKTFYNHYQSVYDVKREMDQQYIDMIFELILQQPEGTPHHDIEKQVGEIVDRIYENPKRAALLFESGELYYLTNQLKIILKPHIREFAGRNNFSEATVGFVIEYVASGMIAVLGSWATGKILAKPSEVKEILFFLIKSSVPVQEVEQLLLPVLSEEL